MTPPDRPPVDAALIAASAYFNKGRCSGHHQFNGRYCRDVGESERWCIHCTGIVLLDALAAAEQRIREHEAMGTKLALALNRAEAAAETLRANYNELILAVGSKYPNETRHQTALRYIQRAEQSSCGSASATDAPKG